MLGLTRSEGSRMLDAARRGPDRPVPQYPGWSLDDLLAHTGTILGRTTIVCRDLLQERPPPIKPPENGDSINWFSSQLDEMLEVLAVADPSAPVWGFGSVPSVGFWTTRMLIEVGVHRFDAQRAWGDPEPLLREVAIAGLDEFEDMWFPRLGEVGPMRFEATDVDRSWEFGSNGSDSVVEGSASDLYLRLMSRPAAVVLPTDWADAVGALTPPPLP